MPTTENVIPESGQSWGSYWTLITAMAVLMFIVYLAANGQLATWLALFIYSKPAVVQPGATVQTPSTTGAPSLATSPLVSLATEGFVDPSMYPAPTPPQGATPPTQGSPTSGTQPQSTFSETLTSMLGKF